MSRRARIAGVVALLVAAVVLLVAGPACNTLAAGRVLREALGPPEALADSVVESDHALGTGADDPRLRVVRPKDAVGPLPAIVLVPGATIAGIDDQRTVALARALARRGLTVGTVDLPALRRLAIDRDDPARLARAALWLAHQPELAADGRVALFGICIGGSYALIAAGDEQLAPHVSAVLAFGAYDDLSALLLSWLCAPAQTDELIAPLTEGRRLVLLGNAPRLVAPGELPVVQAALRALLAGRHPDEPPGLSPGARDVLDVARSETPVEQPRAERLLAPLDDDVAALSLLDAQGRWRPATLERPVFLLHGASDPVVPAEASQRLAAALHGGARLHVTVLFEHVDGATDPSLIEAWPLLRFFADFLAAAGR